jgi:hypothetical protein
MNALFRGTQLAAFADDKPVRLVIEGFQDPKEKLFLNDIQGETQPNYQLLYTIGAAKYLDVFSQRLSPFAITGLHIMTSCTGANVVQQEEPHFYKFYQANNIVTRARQGKGPLFISFNGIVLKSYLIKLVWGSYQKERTDGHQFTLQILADLPDPAEESA